MGEYLDVRRSVLTTAALAGAFALILGVPVGAQQCSTLPGGAVSWWPGEGNAKDIVGGNHGALSAGVSYETGKVGKAFRFDGAGEVKVTDAPTLNLQSFTIEAWVYPTALDGSMEIIVNKESGASLGEIQYEVGIRGPSSPGSIPRGNLVVYVGTPQRGCNQDGGWCDGGAQVPLNTWTHVAVTFDGTTLRAYVNGQLTRQVGNYSGAVPVTKGPLRIGARSPATGTGASLASERFAGRIDEVGLYNRALPLEQLQAVFAAGAAGKCPATMSSVILRELTVNEDMESWPNKGDIHVQLRISNPALSSAGMIDGIDVGEWQMGDGDRIAPNLEVLRVHCLQNEDLEVVIYDDDPGSSGRGIADGSGADDIIHSFRWTNFCAAADKEYTFTRAGYATIKLEKKTADLPIIVRDLAPCVAQTQGDLGGGNRLVSTLYEWDAYLGIITYWLVYRDEDHPRLDEEYDRVRREQWGRIEDVERLTVASGAVGSVSSVQVKYAGSQAYNVDKPDDSLRRTFTAKELTFSDGTHPVVYVATWNHLLSNVASTSAGTYSPCVWKAPLVEKLGYLNVDSLVVDRSKATGFGAAPATVINAASYRAGAVAPDSIATLYGANLATEIAQADSVPLPTSLAGTEVVVTDSLDTARKAGLFFVSPNQVNFLVPDETAPGPAEVTTSEVRVSLQVDQVAPGIFSANANGRGVAAGQLLRVGADGSQYLELVFRAGEPGAGFVAAPIDLGAGGEAWLILYGTGIRGSLSGLSVRIAGQAVPAIAAPQGQYPGLDQVNVGPLPATLRGRGEVEIVVTVDGKAANTVTAYFR